MKILLPCVLIRQTASTWQVPLCVIVYQGTKWLDKRVKVCIFFIMATPTNDSQIVTIKFVTTKKNVYRVLALKELRVVRALRGGGGGRLFNGDGVF